MNKTQGAVQAIIDAHNLVKNNPAAFKKIDISAYIADCASHFYKDVHKSLSIDEYEFDKALMTYHNDPDPEWNIGQTINNDVEFLNIIKIDDHLYYRYRECQAYQTALQRDLTEEEIRQFICENDAYALRSLKEHIEFNYPLFVYAYQIKGNLRFIANIPGYHGICGEAASPQQAVDDAYAILRKSLQ